MTAYVRRIGLIIGFGTLVIFFTIPCLAQNAQQYYQQGLAAYQDGKWELAIQHWKAASSLDPKSAKTHKALGLAYHWLGAGDKDQQKKQADCGLAVEEFEKSVSLNPQYAKAYSNMGEAYECLGDRDKAIQSYEKAISLNPKLKYSYYYLALLYRQRNEMAKARQLVKQGDLQPEEPKEDTDEGWYINFLDYMALKSLGPTLQELR